MKKSTIIWGIAIILIFSAIYVSYDYNHIKKVNSQGNNRNFNANGSAGEAAGFTLTDLAGKNTSLGDFRGKNVYLNFWATWCPPCRGEMPDIEKIYQQFKDKDLVILAVDLGEDISTVKNFVKQNNYHFKVLLDSNQKAATLYNITAIPTSYFIDRNGKIVTKRIGALSEGDMLSNIKGLIP
jgi:thiol-disulfide isomerase/thioredoxin